MSITPPTTPWYSKIVPWFKTLSHEFWWGMGLAALCFFFVWLFFHIV
jgi:hypothetical protein